MAKYFQFLPPGINYDFVGFRSRFLLVSSAAILAAFILIGVRGLNFGIDFSGGTEVQIKFVACDSPAPTTGKQNTKVKSSKTTTTAKQGPKATDQKNVPAKKTPGRQVKVCVSRDDLKPNNLRKKINALFPKSQPELATVGTDGTEFMLKFQEVSFLDDKQVKKLEANLQKAFGTGKDSTLIGFRFRADTGNKVDLTFSRALVIPKAKKADKKADKPKARKPEPVKKAAQPTTKRAGAKSTTQPAVGQKGDQGQAQADYEKIKTAFTAMGLKNVTIEQGSSQGGNYEYTVTFEGLSAQLEERLNNAFGQGAFQIQQVETVGPSVGKKLRNDGILSLLLANLFILIYIAIRFDFRYAPGAVAALLHDVAITTGVFAALQLPFDLTTIAALLTIVGYSLNDTIVVYDRIRENWAKSRVDFGEVMNRSINETLSRTLLTSLTTFIAVLPIYIIGGVNIKWFAFAMMFGILIGTYSSIAIASPLVYWLDQYFNKRMRQEDDEVEAKRERRRRRRAGLRETAEEV